MEQVVLKKVAAVIFFFIFIVPFPFSEGRNELHAATGRSVSMGTSGFESSWYPTASRLSALCARHTDTVITVVSTEGGIENLRLMQAGQLEMGIAEANKAAYSYNGEKLFKGTPYRELRFVTALYPVVFQAVVFSDSGIAGIRELRGKGFSPVNRGSGSVYSSWSEVFNTAFSLGDNDIELKYFSGSALMSAFMDRKTDALGFEGGCPDGSVIELSSKREVTVLPISGSERERLMERYSWYRPWSIGAKTYPGQDLPVETVAIDSIVVADSRLDSRVVYDFVSTLYGPGLESVRNAHEMSLHINPENALSGSGPIPLHPGAEMYYREKRLIR